MSDLITADKFSALPERYQRRAREIAARVSEIDVLCRPAPAQDIGAELKRLRGHLRPQPDTEARDMASGFKDACRDLPSWAISEAANDFLGGRVDSHTGQFMPTCAEFAKRARHIMTPFLAELSSLRIEASKLIERAMDDERRHQIEIERQNPAVRRRVADLAQAFTAGAPKPGGLKHSGLSAEAQSRLDALKKPRQIISKIGHSKQGEGHE
ncbi:hypothetical protein [Mesorhizobium caraganae]|uniref:hypothetical protein n=1 Tax=Mesorhizobium caraganae TaxID=483206 RepID=UPI00178439B3|nr:hypothetical protein [Mesorhizobium caraganae]